MPRLPLHVALALALPLAGACSAAPAAPSASSPSARSPSAAAPVCIKPENSGTCVPLAPDNRRVDLAAPTFSHPTSVTNPLHPSSRIDQVIYGGQVDGSPWRTEFTRLPGTRTISWNGRQVKTIIMQYLAFSDGRIDEVALDFFAQADDGSVWYFGEDVFNYEDGVIKDTAGTWLAGKDGPAAMIMPVSPKVGTAYRSENAFPLVFEEVTVKAVNQTVAGPSGPVRGAYTASELHMDGKREDKTFAPGYGEFSTGNPKGDLEAVSLAVPIDARPGPLPPQFATLSNAVRATFDAVARNDWPSASSTSAALKRAWSTYQSTDVPDLLKKQMRRDIDLLGGAIGDRQSAKAHQAALRVAQNDLDLRLRHEPVAKIDRARFGLWARQILIDATATDTGAVSGDVTTLKWTWDRIRHTLDRAAATRIDTQLHDLAAAAAKKDIAAITTAVPILLAAVPPS